MLEALKITSTTAGNVVIEKRDRRGPQARLRGQDPERVVQAGRQLPDHDAPDDQRRRGHRHARRDAAASWPTSTTRRSTPPWPPLLSILEPIMLIFIGGIVGGLVVSMYLPIFSLMQQF
ncbi:MAG: hypothetical protein MZU91_00785 [Desulfosudis oleivorans]|nr:hypothetical protein [Desulfosudis oleivorans]